MLAMMSECGVSEKRVTRSGGRARGTALSARACPARWATGSAVPAPRARIRPAHALRISAHDKLCRIEASAVSIDPSPRWPLPEKCT